MTPSGIRTMRPSKPSSKSAVICQKMGKAELMYAEDYFDIKVVVERHIAIYNELIQ